MKFPKRKPKTDVIPTRYEQLRRTRKRIRIRNFFEKLIVGLTVGVLGVLVFGAIIVLGTLATYFGWNHGAVNLIHACFGQAKGITFLTALFLNAFLGVLRGGSKLEWKRKSA